MAAPIDLPLALEFLTSSGRLKVTDDWGPAATTGSSYEQFSAKWRGQSVVPTKPELATAWTSYLAAHPEYGLTGAAADRSAVNKSLDTPIGSMRALMAMVHVNYANIPALRVAFSTVGDYIAAIKAEVNNT